MMTISRLFHMVIRGLTRWTRAVSLALGACALLITGCAMGGSSTSPTRDAKPALTIAVMGESDAWGIGTDDPDKINWPSLLAADLPQAPHMINLGAPGVTLAQAQRAELPVVLGEHPDIVVIWLAVNDIIDHVPVSVYSSELTQTVTTIERQNPHTRVFIGNVPDLTLLPYFASVNLTDLRAQVVAWNAAIAQACASTGAILVDIYAAWGRLGDHPDYISYDGLHPSNQGAEAIARVFSVAIERSLSATS